VEQSKQDALLTVDEVADMLRVGKWMVYDYVRRGILPVGVAIHLGRSIRFSRKALEAWLEAGGLRDAGEMPMQASSRRSER
jgi:excisionase family DNA binding protein